MNQLSEDNTFISHEKSVVEKWRDNNLYDLLIKQKSDTKFVLMDGPPFVSGSLHMGHLSISNIKSTIFNYMQMNGFNCKFKLGYDCHGLPIENLVCKENDLKTLDQIKTLGTSAFNELCDKTIDRYSKSWTPIFESIGRLADFNNVYMTRDVKFMETCIWIFKRLWDNGLVYRGNKVMAYSWACQTPLSNFESSQNYIEIETKSIYVSFKLENTNNKYLVAWTTTPWTLPSNMGLCVNAEIDYVEVEFNDNVYICSKNSVERIFGKNAKIINQLKGAELIKLTYEPLFNFVDKIDESLGRPKRTYRIFTDSYVRDSDIGSSVVHLAPAFGDDDFRVCFDNKVIDNVTVSDYCPIDLEGKFDQRVEPYKGQLVFETEDQIRNELKQRKLLLKTQLMKHNYPHCYRTNTPLIYRTAESFYIRVSALKDRMIEHNKKVTWHPEEIGSGRFHEWLDNAKDWAVSRFRFYGTPVPVWESEDGEDKDFIVVGSIDELYELTGIRVDNLHPQFLDKIEIIKNGRTYKRNSAILDCWFESGAVPFAQIGYPFNVDASKELESREFLSDLICEGLDQTRGWFYTLLVLSTAILDKPPFRNVICTGLVLDKNGKKISKSAGNFVDPNVYIEKFGADYIRLYLISSPLLKAEPLKFDEKNLVNLKQNFIPLINGVKFFIEHALNYKHKVLKDNELIINNIDYSKLTNLMDKWVIERLDVIISNVKKFMINFEISRAVDSLVEFIEDLTNWYIKFNRDRVKGAYGNEDWEISLTVLFNVLIDYFILLAPFAPFLSELIFDHLKTCSNKYKNINSILLMNYPKSKLSEYPSIDIMKELQHICQMVRTLRCQTPNHTKVVIPIKNCKICCASDEYLESIKSNIELIRGELNCINFEFENIKHNTVLKVVPDFKTIGKQFGKKSSEVIKFLENLDQNQIRTLYDNHDNKSHIVYEEHILDQKYFQIKAIPLTNNSETNYVSMIDGILLIKIDHTYDEEICRLYQIKKLHSLIQETRKDLKLRPWNKISIIIDSKMIDKSVQIELQKMLHNADIYRGDTKTSEINNSDILTVKLFGFEHVNSPTVSGFVVFC